MGALRRLAPAYLEVSPNREQQRRAAAALIRPADVTSVALSLAHLEGPFAAEAELVAHFLGGLRYFLDPPWIDIWRSPLATLSLGGGDCEDLSILGLSLLLALGGGGHLVVGIYYSRRGPIGHAWLEGRDSAGYLHIDATTAVVSRLGRPPGYVALALYTPSPA
jgi:hypothetical protein